MHRPWQPAPDFQERTKTRPDDPGAATKQGLIVGMLLLGAFASEIFIGSIAGQQSVFGRLLPIP